MKNHAYLRSALASACYSALIAGLATPALAVPQGTLSPSGILPSGIVTPVQVDATNAQFGNCPWTATGDSGPCVNAAIAYVGANPGKGTVRVPGGLIGWATPIVNNNAGVRLVGAGLGNPHDPTSGLLDGGTVMVWTGGASAGPGIDVEPASGTASMYSDDIDGIWFNGANKLTTVARVASVSYSHFNFGVANWTGLGLDASTNNGVSSNGAQHNTGSFFAYASSAPTGSIGLMFRHDAGSTTDWSLNTFTELFSNVNAGVNGKVFANGDRNTLMQCTGYGSSPDLVVNNLFTLPASLGTATSPNWRDMTIVVNDCHLDVQGLQAGATLVATSVSGTEGPTTISTTTTATTSLNPALAVASTTGMTAGMALNLTGGYAAGLPPNMPILAVGSSTSLKLQQQTVGAVAGSVNVTASFGMQQGAPAGVYTLTYNGSNYTLTPPSGSTQSVAPSGGALTFSYVVIPWITGTPVLNDTWTLTTATSTPSNIQVFATDNGGTGGNAIPDPFFEFNITGSAGCYGNNANISCQYTAGQQGVVIGAVTNSASGQNSSVIGGANNAAVGQNSAVHAGGGNTASGLGSLIDGGGSNTITTTANYGSVLGGLSNTIAGPWSVAMGGSKGNDGGRKNCTVQGGGAAISGGLQHLVCEFSGSGSGTTIQLTSDGGAASSVNCGNLTPNTVDGLRITLSAIDSATSGRSFTASWGVNTAPHMLTQGAAAANTLIDNVTTTIPADLTRSIGTLTGVGATIQADTTRGCMALVLTRPTDNSDAWFASAAVEIDETVQ